MYSIRLNFIGVGYSPNYENLKRYSWVLGTVPEYVLPQLNVNITDVVAK